MDNIFLFQGDQEEKEPTEVDFQNQFQGKKIDAPYIFQESFEEQPSQQTEEIQTKDKEEEKQKPILKNKRQSLKEMNNVYLKKRKPKDRGKWEQEEIEIEKFEKKEEKQIDQWISEQKVQRSSQHGIPGVSIKENEACKLQYVGQKKALKVTDLKHFLYTPLAQYKIRAIIRKQDLGLFNTKTKYSIFIEQNNRFILSVLRDGLSNYIFSLSKENISPKNKNYLGSMVGNVSGTNFILYDNGFNPNQTRSLQYCRKQIASISYQQSKGPRKFETLITTNSKGFYALEEEVDVLKQKWSKKEKQSLRKLYSKMPQYDPIDGNYKLDFKGIVKEASVKNFILMTDETNQSLIFGKINKQTFIMEIKEPFSVYQAAAICISSIHYKLHWA